MNKSNVLKAGIVSTVLLATVLGTNVKVFGATNDVIKDVKYVFYLVYCKKNNHNSFILLHFSTLNKT